MEEKKRKEKEKEHDAVFLMEAYALFRIPVGQNRRGEEGSRGMSRAGGEQHCPARLAASGAIRSQNCIWLQIAVEWCNDYHGCKPGTVYLMQFLS